MQTSAIRGGVRRLMETALILSIFYLPLSKLLGCISYFIQKHHQKWKMKSEESILKSPPAMVV